VRAPPLLVPLAVGGALGVASTAFPVGDSDIYWHLATARASLEEGLVRADRFSWTIAGQPVPTDQWLGQLLWYASYAVAGWRGIVGLRALCVAALVAIVLAVALSRRPRAPLIAVIASLPAIFLSRFIWVERPELFGFVCFAALLPLLQRLRVGGGAAAWPLAVLLVLWSNLHGSFALGSLLTALVAGEGLWSDRGRAVRYLGAMGAVALSFLATPALLATASTPGIHFFDPPREIQEWGVPGLNELPGLIWASTLLLVLAVALLSRPIRLAEVAVLVPVAFLSMTAVRHMPFLAIAAAPYLAERLPEAAGRLRSLLRLEFPLPVLPEGGPPPRRLDLAAGALALTAVAAASATAPDRPDMSGYPVPALAALAPGPGLFNQYDWGGWLIWSAPATPVFIDGRLTPYRASGVLEEYRTVIGLRPGWREVIERRGIRALLLRPNDAAAVRARDLGWPVRSASAEHVLIEVR
jgi:hypothetical protein